MLDGFSGWEFTPVNVKIVDSGLYFIFPFHFYFTFLSFSFLIFYF